jgi:hypothetical protein
MLALSIDAFDVEFKEGSIKNVGPTNKRVTAKLFDVTESTARPYGDDRVKLVFEDGEGDEVQVALSEDDAAARAAEIEGLGDERAAED